MDFGLKTNYIFNENHSIGARYEYYRLPYSKVDLLFPSKFTIDGEYLQESLSDVITREPSYRHNFNTYYSGKIAIIIGNEGSGISQLVSRNCD